MLIESKSSSVSGGASPEVATESAALTKAEMADVLFDQVGLNKRESKEMVDAFFDELRACLVRGEMVKLSGFGNFQLGTSHRDLGETPKQASPFLFRQDVLLPSTPVRS